MLLSSAQLAFALVLAPSLASAAIFPKDSLVKMLDPKGFRQAMKANQTSMVAFVAPWCGHCQRMAPEYSKAAVGLNPLVPVYAVDCDAEENKRLCSEQGVKGFPTVKLFPRGNQLGSMTYDSGDRTANALFNWASRRVPNTVTKLSTVDDITPWVEKTLTTKNRALLLTKDKKVPLLWKVLGNKYKDQLELGIHRDIEGKTSEVLGLEAGGEKQAKVLLYPAGSTKFARYEGTNKLEPLSRFLDSVLDGTADFSVLHDQAAVEESVSGEAKETKTEVEEEVATPVEEKAEEVQEVQEAPTTESEPTQGVLDDAAEQVVLEQPKDEVEKVVPTDAQCEPAEDGPGAEAPVECEPPTVPKDSRPADEL